MNGSPIFKRTSFKQEKCGPLISKTIESGLGVDPASKSRRYTDVFWRAQVALDIRRFGRVYVRDKADRFWDKG